MQLINTHEKYGWLNSHTTIYFTRNRPILNLLTAKSQTKTDKTNKNCSCVCENKMQMKNPD